MPNTHKKVLLIGWDAADWKIINPLLDAGKMPELSKLVESGVIGNMATLYPALSPMLWTSVATGQRPFRHGVLGFSEPAPQTGFIRPISVLSRKTKAVWNILNQQGKKSVVVGWWPSHPAEPINGVMVSDHYSQAHAPYGEPWPMRPGSVHPPRLIHNLAELRQHPQEVDPGLVRLFVERFSEIDQDEDKRIEILAKNISECTSICNAAQAILHHEPWDFAAVYFDSIDHFCHAFMHYHPPRLPWVSDQDFGWFNKVVESAYIYHDILLGRLLRETGDDTTVILISDHGFHSDHLRPHNLPVEPAGPALQHRHFGIFAAKGPEIKQDELIYGTSLLDVCPTILTLYGLPVGEDMDGKPLLNIFKEPPELNTIPSWEEVPGDDGRHPADTRVDPVDETEALRQLVALGYIEEPPENRQKAVNDTVCELTYNLARSYMDALRYAEAVPHLEKLCEQYPDEYRFAHALANCCFAMGQIPRARKLVDTLFEVRAKNRLDAVEEFKKLREEHKGADKDDEQEQMDEQEKKRLQAQMRKLRAEIHMPTYALEYLAGCVCHEEGENEKALEHLHKAQNADSTQLSLFLKLGDVFLRMRRDMEARQAYERALELDPDNASAWHGMARVLLRSKEDQEAAEAALHSVGLIFHNPKAHFTLAFALIRLGYIPKAAHALQLATSQNPNFAQAWSLLALLHKRHLNNPAKYLECRENARQAACRIKAIRTNNFDLAAQKELLAGASLTSDQTRPEPILSGSYDASFVPERTAVIVSGLPRSGTSMMMQLLEAGGLPVLSDNRRRADSSNTKGYYEHEWAKSPAAFPKLLSEANGKAVKIVAQLLRNLPRLPEISYRVILMERALDEVLASQQAMLRREQKDGAALSSEDLAAVYRGQMQQVKQMLAAWKIPVLLVNYNEAVREPLNTAEKINIFLNGTLDAARAASVIDPALYRQRREKAEA